VYLLPIELRGKTQEEANEKALVIFETINNRGLNLEDADIFKAKLYKKAKNVKEHRAFIDSWVDFKKSCENLNLEIDDVFRYYAHIIRGKERITSSEINLRLFFLREKYSPFNLKKYKDILKDLFKIIEVLEFVNREKHGGKELAKWLQLIDAYTNQYPRFAVVTYFFINGFDENERLISFLKSLVRYVYYQGSTSSVKFEIYKMVKQICAEQEIDDYYVSAKIEDFDYLGRLKYGYALLAFYVDRQKPLSNYGIDKLINLKDKNYLSGNWTNVDFGEIVDSLGNFVVLDIPKKNMSFHEKIDYYKKSNIEEVRQILTSNFTHENLKRRDKDLKERLINFF